MKVDRSGKGSLEVYCAVGTSECSDRADVSTAIFCKTVRKIFDSPCLKRLYQRVQAVKSNEGIEVKYMQLWEEMLMERMEGEAKGEAYFVALTERLLRDSKPEDLLKAVDDKAFREKLYKEYGIKNN